MSTKDFFGLKFDGTKKLKSSLAKLTAQEVLVGIPASKNERETEDAAVMNNATLAFIHNNGSPAQGVPARPFMEPAVELTREATTKVFKEAAQKGTKGSEAAESAANKALKTVGLMVSQKMKELINLGLYPELKPETIANRYKSRQTLKQRKGEKEYLERVKAGEMSAQVQASLGIKPLVNTGQLRNALTYVLRKR